jgi:integrase/recombinase XerD
MGLKHVGAPAISEVLPRFLEHIRVEEGRVPITIARYRSHIQRYITLMGDGPITAMTADAVSVYRSKLLDNNLSPMTMSTLLSGLRSFLRYARTVERLRVLDPQKIKRPRIPNRTVEYLSPEETGRLLEAIPTHNLNGLRDRALMELLFSSGMRISEALSLDRPGTVTSPMARRFPLGNILDGAIRSVAILSRRR